MWKRKPGGHQPQSVNHATSGSGPGRTPNANGPQLKPHWAADCCSQVDCALLVTVRPFTSFARAPTCAPP